MSRLTSALICGTLSVGICQYSNAESTISPTIQSVEYAFAPDIGEEIVTAVFDNGVLTYWRATGEFRYQFGDGTVKWARSRPHGWMGPSNPRCPLVETNAI